MNGQLTLAARGDAVVVLAVRIPRAVRIRLLRRLRIWFRYQRYRAPTTRQRLERAGLRRLAAAPPAPRSAPAADRRRVFASLDSPSDMESEPR